MDAKEKELIVIDGMMEAEIIKSRLESFGIPAILKFETAGRLMGISMNGLGKVRVVVPEEELERAQEILDSIDNSNDSNDSEDSDPPDNGESGTPTTDNIG